LFGKIVSWETSDNEVKITYEKQEVTVKVITDEIIRVLVPLWKKGYESIAIEGDPSVPVDFDVTGAEGTVEIKTGAVTLTLKDDFQFVFTNCEGTTLLSSYNGVRAIKPTLSDTAVKLLEAEGHVLDEGQKPHDIELLFNLRDDERFYGLGDKTGFLNKHGFSYENWNSDIPQLHHENMPALYKSIPFVIGASADATYGLFFDNTFHSYIDMGCESTDYFFYGADDGNIDMYFMAGEAMADIIEHYTYLTGRAPLPQLWTLGYHQCRWGYESATDIRDIATKMRANKIPCESVQYDIDYMEGYRVFTWDETNYEPKGQLISELAKDGFKAVCIIDPGVKVDKGYFMYDEGVENDYFARDPETDEIYVNEVWPGDSVYPDFGRADVRDWWGDSHKKLVDMGMQGIWNDMNEPASFRGPLPDDVKFHIEDRLTDHSEVHNVYGHFMSMATYEGMKKLTGKRPLVITRACYSGTQKYSAVWTGDNQSVWSHLRMLTPQLCNLGISGFPIAGTDIGGFGGNTNPELLTRWIQAATFSTFFRNHCAKGHIMQEPWNFGEQVTNIYRKYVELHYRFLPYIYDLLFECQITGLPVMRPLVLHYEDDENTFNLNDEYLVGENILVAPVVDPGVTKRMVYLPVGTWVNYWNGARFTGGQHILVDAPIDTMPIFIKEGSIIPMYEPVQYVGEKPFDTLELLVTGDSCFGYHYQDNGEDFEYLQGQYNLYSFTYENEKLETELLYEGYKRYNEIRVVKL